MSGFTEWLKAEFEDIDRLVEATELGATDILMLRMLAMFHNEYREGRGYEQLKEEILNQAWRLKVLLK